MALSAFHEMKEEVHCITYKTSLDEKEKKKERKTDNENI